MKKFYLGAGALACSLLLMTGCGGSSKNVTCTTKIDEEGQKYTAEIVAELDSDDKVKDVSMSMVFDDSDSAEQFYQTWQALVTMAKQAGEDMPDLGLKKSGKKITISNFEAYEQMYSGEDSKSPIGMTKDEFIEQAQKDEETSWTCK